MSKQCICYTRRPRRAEEVLVGKTLNQEIADEAARIAVTGAMPIRYNCYIVQVARTLGERTVI